VRWEWAVGALCVGQTDTMYPEDRHATAAKALCRECPCRVPCLEHALKHNEKDGVWGGTTRDDRARIRKRRAAK